MSVHRTGVNHAGRQRGKPAATTPVVGAATTNVAGPTGTSAGIDELYETNNLNQYVNRENNTVRVLGTVAKANANVAVAGATHLKATTDAPNHWLAHQLDMGSPFYVSKHTGLLRRHGGAAASLLAK